MSEPCPNCHGRGLVIVSLSTIAAATAMCLRCDGKGWVWWR